MKRFREFSESLKIRGGGRGFQVVQKGKVLKDFTDYDDAVKHMTSLHKASKESEDWHEDRKTFGAADARKRMGR